MKKIYEEEDLLVYLDQFNDSIEIYQGKEISDGMGGKKDKVELVRLPVTSTIKIIAALKEAGVYLFYGDQTL